MSQKSDNPNAFKLWISPQLVEKYFSEICPSEIKSISHELQNLELRARVQLIASKLKQHLPKPYKQALPQLLKITRQQKLKSFELWPATEFIQMNGLDYIDESLQAMYKLTSLFTAEFSVRPFLNLHDDAIYDRLLAWRQDPNEHIRRWLSEGTRPRLPWGEKLHRAVRDPKRGLEILEHLKFDPSLYVRKSVANHLNDIAKDHPDLVVRTLTMWKKQLPPSYQKEFQFICQRALRTLIKEGHPQALQFMGVQVAKTKLKISSFKLSHQKVKTGQSLEISGVLHNTSKKSEKFILDYVVYHQKANGKLSPKVFKLKTGHLAGGEKIQILKKHSFKLITTRQYHQGEHKIALKLNGRELPSLKVWLS